MNQNQLKIEEFFSIKISYPQADFSSLYVALSQINLYSRKASRGRGVKLYKVFLDPLPPFSWLNQSRYGEPRFVGFSVGRYI